MPFEIVRNDITNMQVDAIVNTANPRPVVGAGTDSAIHEKAGPELLLARRQIGSIDPGCAAITPAFRLRAKYVIHTVGPVWMGGNEDEEVLLRSCYETALKLAAEQGCQSVAFPLISSGNYGFPKDKALQVAINAFSNFLLNNEMQIYLVVYDRDSYKLSEKLFSHIASYIDENYVEDWDSASVYKQIRRQRDREVYKEQAILECAAMPATAGSLAGALEDLDIGFSEALLNLIDASGKKDSEVYKKANVSKQHFSKIRNNPDYKPTKATALAFCIALELDLKQTKELIERAGYALTNSSKFDIIIRYYIERRKYDIVEINIALYEFDQNLLGA